MTRKPGRTRPDYVRLNLDAIGVTGFVERVCVEYGVSFGRVIEQRRYKTACAVRRLVWTVLRHTLDLSFPEIADLFLVDHSVVSRAVHRRERELEEMYA